METSKTFKRISIIVDFEMTKKSQRGYVGKLFGKWYDKQLWKKLVEMPRIQPKTIRVTNTNGEVSFI